MKHSESVTVAELSQQRGLPPNLVAAFGRLSAALGNPKAFYTEERSIEVALIDEAVRLLGLWEPKREAR